MKSLLTLIMILYATCVFAQTDADSSAIKETAFNYIEGWYEGNAERMAKSLHPKLAKRAVFADDQFSEQTAEILIQRTEKGGGKKTPIAQQQKEVTILDIFEGSALVKVVASDWVDYLQIAKLKDQWLIINVLWEIKPDSYQKFGMKKK